MDQREVLQAAVSDAGGGAAYGLKSNHLQLVDLAHPFPRPKRDGPLLS